MHKRGNYGRGRESQLTRGVSTKKRKERSKESNITKNSEKRENQRRKRRV